MHLVSNQVAGLIDTSRIETDKFKNPPQAEYNIVDFTFLKSKKCSSRKLITLKLTRGRARLNLNFEFRQFSNKANFIKKFDRKFIRKL